MQFTLFNILSIVILFQLVLLMLFLFTSSKGKPVSNVILGLFFLVLAINIADGVLSVSGFFEKFPQWAHLEDGFILLFGPLLYFYTCSVVYKDFSVRLRHLLHIVPFIVITVSLLAFYHSQTEEQKRFIEAAVLKRELPPQFYFITGLVYLHVMSYIVASFQKVLIYRDELKQRFSSIRKVSVDWLVFLLLSVTIILLVSLVNVMIPVAGPHEWFNYSLMVVVIILFVFINLVLLKGLKHPEIFAGIEITTVAEPTTDPATVAKEWALIDARLHDLMKIEKVFLDPEINLDLLAEKVGISSKKLSQVINATYKKNFFDYVNSFRIEEAGRILREATDPGLTVLEVMYQSGFNSKSSFNTIFKKTTGLTPTAYRQKHRA
jgi:AraC-like DNA-binding protein